MPRVSAVLTMMMHLRSAMSVAGSRSSSVSWSLEKIASTRPWGVTSNHALGARRTRPKMVSCILLDAPSIRDTTAKPCTSPVTTVPPISDAYRMAPRSSVPFRIHSPRDQSARTRHAARQRTSTSTGTM
eukprot:scaffold63289_cov28-Tisochrysis_lutea.AAC.1